jgi:hypothetical protein
MCTCEHDAWDHEMEDESVQDDSFVAGKCEVEGCTCEKFEEMEDD